MAASVAAIPNQSLIYNADTVDVDAHGHIARVTHKTLDFKDAVIQISEYSQGDKIANILGVDIHAGIAWGTF